MKRALAVFLVISALCACLHGCAKKKQVCDYLSEGAIEVGEKAVEVIDEFLGGTMDAKTAARKLESLSNSSRFDDSIYFDRSLALGISIAASRLSLYNNPFSTTTKSDIREARDSLHERVYGK